MTAAAASCSTAGLHDGTIVRHDDGTSVTASSGTTASVTSRATDVRRNMSAEHQAADDMVEQLPVFVCHRIDVSDSDVEPEVDGVDELLLRHLPETPPDRPDDVQDFFLTSSSQPDKLPPRYRDHSAATPNTTSGDAASSRTAAVGSRDQRSGVLATRLGHLFNSAILKAQKQLANKGATDLQWYFSQVKGATDDDVADADIISCVEFSRDGELLATGDKGGRVVIFQRDQDVMEKGDQSRSADYGVYCTFQSHEPEFDYLKSLEIEEKINKIQWLKRSNPAHFLLSTNDKTIKLWKLMERSKQSNGMNLKDDEGMFRDPASITSLRVPVFSPVDMMVEASPRRVFANAHTYHINSISVNSDQETYISADDLRINLWHLGITNQSFNIVDIKPANMEELTEVITAAEFHPVECNLFVYSSSKGILRLCDMRSQALCDQHAKLFEEPEDASSRSFFSEIITSMSDVRFSHTGRYVVTRDYLTVKVWDVNMDTRPIEVHNIHDYLRSKLCALYENDCIFDKFECSWSSNDRKLLTGSYNNFFRMFDRESKRDVTFEASYEGMKPKQLLKPRRVGGGGGAKRKKDEVSVDSLDFGKKVLYTAWHPADNLIAVAATNNLYLYEGKE